MFLSLPIFFLREILSSRFSIKVNIHSLVDFDCFWQPHKNSISSLNFGKFL